MFALTFSNHECESQKKKVSRRPLSPMLRFRNPTKNSNNSHARHLVFLPRLSLRSHQLEVYQSNLKDKRHLVREVEADVQRFKSEVADHRETLRRLRRRQDAMKDRFLAQARG